MGEGESKRSIIQWFSHGELFMSNTKEVVEQSVLLNFYAVFFPYNLLSLWEIQRLQTFPDSRSGLTYIFGIISSLIL